MTGVALIFIGLNPLRDYDLGVWAMWAGFLLVGMVWTWSIWEVIVAEELGFVPRVAWLIVTIALPVVGGLLFNVMRQPRPKVATESNRKMVH